MDYIKAVKLHRKLGHIGRELSGLRGMRPHGMARPTHFPEGEGHHRHPGPHHGPGHRGGILPRERILLILKNAPEEGLRQKDIASASILPLCRKPLISWKRTVMSHAMLIRKTADPHGSA